jgi:hypothetical protein
MSFSYNIALDDNKDIVRFHIGDTDANGHYLDDETINALITSEGSVGGAVVACIMYIMTQLSSPDFKQDWMEVSNKNARQGFEELLRLKRNHFGISTGVTAASTIKNPYRKDSDQHTTGTRVETADTANTSKYDGN